MRRIELGGRLCYIAQQGQGGPAVYWGIQEGAGAQAERVAALAAQGAAGAPFTLVAYEAPQWNAGFSPWPAPPVFGSQGFAGRGPETLAWLLHCCLPAVQREYRLPAQPQARLLAGYSLAGLFAMWAFYSSGQFGGVASCSGSLWFPGWAEFAAKAAAPPGSRVYLSLGQAEERAKNPVMAGVGRATRAQAGLLLADNGVARSTLEWHPGGHFKQVEERTAQGIAWLVRP